MNNSYTDKNLHIDRQLSDLIDKWYAAETTPAEDRLLAYLLQMHTDLPADVQSVKEILNLINESGLETIEIPDDISARIISNVESGMKEKSPWRYILRGVAVAAILAGGAFFGFHKLEVPDISIDDERLANAITTSHTIQDTLCQSLIPQTQIAVEEIKSYSKNKKSSTKPLSNKSSLAKTIQSIDTLAFFDSSPLTPEEEEVIRSGKYHVVTDAGEAESIIESIFVSLHQNTQHEIARISKIDLKQQKELEKLENLPFIKLPLKTVNSDEFNPQIPKTHEIYPI